MISIPLISFFNLDLGNVGFFFYFLSASAIKDCSVVSAIASTTTAVFQKLRSLTCLHLPTQTQPVTSLRSVCQFLFPRKEVIQPHLPVRLPCYDFTPVTNPALGRCSLAVSSRTSGVVDFHGVTGGVYKTRERIQRSVLICVY